MYVQQPSYYVRGEGGGCGPTSCVSVTIQVLNRPSLPGSISGPTFGLCNLTGVSYSILPVSGATSYQWTTSPGISITSGQGSSGITVSFGGDALPGYD
ncbi:MAG: hypothetical protein IPJ66_10815 [Bacteroidetes bacterium]|nr:hypothetical protein [Bacteroidota bacterium]